METSVFKRSRSVDGDNSKIGACNANAHTNYLYWYLWSFHSGCNWDMNGDRTRTGMNRLYDFMVHLSHCTCKEIDRHLNKNRHLSRDRRLNRTWEEYPFLRPWSCIRWLILMVFQGFQVKSKA